VQFQHGVEPIEEAAQLDDVDLVGEAAVDLVEEPSKPTDLVGDLRVASAHRAGRVGASEQTVEGRIEVRLLGCLVRGNFLHQEPMDLPHTPQCLHTV
jgi:hypothetical protein